MAGAERFHSAPMEQDEACTRGQQGKHQMQTMGNILPFRQQNGRTKQYPCQSKQEDQAIQAQGKELFQQDCPLS